MATFYEYLRKKGLSEGTAGKYVAIANRWRKREVSVETYLAEVRNDRMPQGTATPILAAARHWAAYEGYELEETLPWEERTGYQGVVMSRVEALALLKRARPLALGGVERSAWRAAVVALESGLRGSSICELLLEHAESARYRVHAKGGKLLTAPLTSRAVKAIRAQFSAHPEGFPDPKTLRRGWREVANKAEAPGVTLHTFRHTFASHLESIGVRLSTISKILGHNDIQVTARYLHVADAEVKQALERLEQEQDHDDDVGR